MSLAACGAAGSDSVFTRSKPKKAEVDSTPTPAFRIEPPPSVTRPYAGYYRKAGEEQQFQPCGTTQLLDITASFEAKLLLRERFRWNAIYEGAKLFAVFEGAIVIDTIESDSSKPTPRKRFYLTDIDSMRSWRRSDCNGMRIPTS